MTRLETVRRSLMKMKKKSDPDQCESKGRHGDESVQCWFASLAAYLQSEWFCESHRLGQSAWGGNTPWGVLCHVCISQTWERGFSIEYRTCQLKFFKIRKGLICAYLSFHMLMQPSWRLSTSVSICTSWSVSPDEIFELFSTFSISRQSCNIRMFIDTKTAIAWNI